MTGKIMDQRGPWILAFLVLLYAYRLIIIGHLQLAPDEAYYWYWSKFPAWGYVDHPPFVAYIMAFFTGLGGDTEFFVRLGGLLCSAVILMVVYLIVRKLFPGTGFAWEVLFLFNITLLFSAGCIVQTPDTPLLLFWAFAVLCGSYIVTGAGAGWWYIWGVALGLGLLSKFTMVLIIPCQFAFLVFSPPCRRWLFRKEPSLGILTGLLIFSPVIVWNWHHQWVSFAFQLGQGFSFTRESALRKLLQYVGSQAGVITPLLFLAFILYSLKGLAFSIPKKIMACLYLAFLSWPILVFFGISSSLGESAEGNWPAPAYVAGLILMWAAFRELYYERKWHRRFMQVAVTFAFVLNVLLHIHLLRPIIPIPPEMDMTKQFHGWRGLGKKIDSYIKDHPSSEGYFLLADRGTTVAEAVFYTGGKWIGVDFSRPERYVFLGDLSQLKGKNAIILLEKYSPGRLQEYSPYFTEIREIGDYSAAYRGKKIIRLNLKMLLGKTYLGNWDTLMKKKEPG